MRIHLIAIGGSAMHNLALALKKNGHEVSGSDDEIYNPAKTRLAEANLLPEQEGWFPDKITPEIDIIILGMHARSNNPELEKALAIGLKIYSYPEYIYEHAKDKIRVVVAGSHGKTTTTAMIMHILKESKINFDYLVGAQLEGFDTMVQLSDAPVMIIEGDEYLSSPIDLRPKILHYKPSIAILTGIAWDHINVFPTFDIYVAQFEKFIQTIEPNGSLIYYQNDLLLQKLIKELRPDIEAVPYKAFKYYVAGGNTIMIHKDKELPLKFFGKHNLENLRAAWYVCKRLGIKKGKFHEAIVSFKGAGKRLQILKENKTSKIFLDFAHAPSKIKSTIYAVKAQFPDKELIAIFELHTFSSLNKDFLPEYEHTMDVADKAMVFYSPHTLEVKKLNPISEIEIKEHFGKTDIKVFIDNNELLKSLSEIKLNNKILLFMTSGNFGGLDLNNIAEKLIAKT